jgi:hypothetical protein
MLSLAFAICKPCLLLLPPLLDTRADRRMRPFLRTSGFPGSEVEREMSRAWLVVGRGSVDAARFSRWQIASLRKHDVPCTSSKAINLAITTFAFEPDVKSVLLPREGLRGSGMIDSVIEASGAESLVTTSLTRDS